MDQDNDSKDGEKWSDSGYILERKAADRFRKKGTLTLSSTKGIRKEFIGSYNWEAQSGAVLTDGWNQESEGPSLFLSRCLPASLWVSGSFPQAGHLLVAGPDRRKSRLTPL